MRANFKKIIGKTITGVVVKESNFNPRSQVFLIFSDKTSYELWSDAYRIEGNSEIQNYGVEGVRAYMAETHRIVFEAHDETEGE